MYSSSWAVTRATLLRRVSSVASIGLFTHSMPCPCHAHAVPMPCHTAKCLELSFPFDLHSAAVSDSYLSYHADAMLRPCRSSQGHSTARPSLDIVPVQLECSGSLLYPEGTTKWWRLLVRNPRSHYNYKVRTMGVRLSFVSVVCCQVEASATGWSLVQRSPTDCGISERGLETLAMLIPRPTRAVEP